MQNRKVLIISDRFYPENMAVAIRNLSFVRSLADIGVDVTILTGTKLKTNYKTKLIWSYLPKNTDGFVIRFLKEIILGSELFLRILYKNKYHITIISSPPFFSSLMAAMALVFKKKKYLFDIRDDYPQVFFSKGIVEKETRAGKFLISIRNYIYKNSWAISTVTKSIYNELPKNCNSLLIRNGFDAQMFNRSKIKKENFTVVFHGSLSQFQDIQLLLDVANNVLAIDESIKFIVAGKGSKDYLLKNNLPSNLSYIGEVKYENIPNILQSSHLGLSFRTNDQTSRMSFPVKVYEYIGAGIPCIISPISEAGEEIEAKKMGFMFNPNSKMGITKKIYELANNVGIYNSCVDNVIFHREFFSRENQLTPFINKFEETFKK